MTKKDYEFFAQHIHSYTGSLPAVPAKVFNSWVDLTADVFANDNIRFDRDKYKRACYEGKHIRKSIKEGI